MLNTIVSPGLALLIAWRRDRPPAASMPLSSVFETVTVPATKSLTMNRAPKNVAREKARAIAGPIPRPVISYREAARQLNSVQCVNLDERDPGGIIRSTDDGCVAGVARRKRGNDRRLVVVRRRQGRLNLRCITRVFPVVVRHQDVTIPVVQLKQRILQR